MKILLTILFAGIFSGSPFVLEWVAYRASGSKEAAHFTTQWYLVGIGAGTIFNIVMFVIWRGH